MKEKWNSALFSNTCFHYFWEILHLIFFLSFQKNFFLGLCCLNLITSWVKRQKSVFPFSFPCLVCLCPGTWETSSFPILIKNLIVSSVTQTSHSKQSVLFLYTFLWKLAIVDLILLQIYIKINWYFKSIEINKSLWSQKLPFDLLYCPRSYLEAMCLQATPMTRISSCDVSTNHLAF